MGSPQNPIAGAIWGHPDTQTPQSDPYGVTPTPKHHSQIHMGSPQNPIGRAIEGHPDIADRPIWRPQNPIGGAIWGHPDTRTYSQIPGETPKPHRQSHRGTPRHPNLQSDPYRVTPKPHRRSHMGSHQNPIAGAIWGHPDTAVRPIWGHPKTPQPDPYGATPTPEPPSSPTETPRPTVRPIWGHPNTPTYSQTHTGSPQNPIAGAIQGHPKTP